MADGSPSGEIAVGKRIRYDWSNPERYLGFTAPCNAHRTFNLTSNLYLMRSGPFSKIGVADDVNKRLLQFQAGNPHGIRLAGRFEVPKPLARQIEQRLHGHFVDVAIGREWFRGLTYQNIRRPARDLIDAANEAMRRWREDGFLQVLADTF